ncbi:MAG: DMT family transporter [Pseudomonadota bacterium]
MARTKAQTIMIKEHKDNPVFGMLTALTAFFLFAVMNAFAKLLSEDFHVVEIAFWRNLLCIFPIVIYFYLTNQTDLMKPKKPRAVYARGALGALSLVVTFQAFILMPMADATAFVFTAALIAPVMAIFFLSEKVGPYRWAAIAIGFCGVLIMAQPTGDTNYLGIAFALSAAFIHAVMQVLLRHIGKADHPMTTVFYFVTIGCLLTAPFIPFVGHMPSAEDFLLLIPLAASGGIAQIMISNAFKYAEASVVSVFNYSGIVWATALGWFIFGDWPALQIWIGAAIVISCNLFIFWRERQIQKKSY